MLAIEVDRNIRAGDVLHVLTDLFTRHRAPDCIRSDNGSEFTAKVVRDWLRLLHRYEIQRSKSGTQWCP